MYVHPSVTVCVHPDSHCVCPPICHCKCPPICDSVCPPTFQCVCPHICHCVCHSFCYWKWLVVAEWLRAQDSSSGVSDQSWPPNALSTLVLRMGCNAAGPVICVTHVKEPKALIEKRRGSPQCSWFDWLHIAPQHLVNHSLVLCKESRSYNSNAVPYNYCWLTCVSFLA